MVQTAKFVRESGGHSELVLRVRQAANPNFAFLRPDDLRHAYFRWLVTADPQVLDWCFRESEYSQVSQCALEYLKRKQSPVSLGLFRNNFKFCFRKQDAVSDAPQLHCLHDGLKCEHSVRMFRCEAQRCRIEVVNQVWYWTSSWSMVRKSEAGVLLCAQEEVHDSREGESGAAGHRPDSAEKDADVAASQNALAMLGEYGSQQAESPRVPAWDLMPDEALPPVSTVPPAAAEATDAAPITLPTKNAGPMIISAEVVSAAGVEEALADKLTTGVEEVRQNGQGGQQLRAEPEVARDAEEPEEAGRRQGTPPGDVQAIMAKLVGFVKVRPAPVISPMMRQNRPMGLWSCG